MSSSSSSSSSSVMSEMTEVLPEKPQALTSIWDSLRSLTIFRRSHEYVPLNLQTRLHVSTRYRSAVKLVLAVVTFLVLIMTIASFHPVATAREHGILPIQKYAPIPRIAHYVYLQKDEHSTIEFGFSSFLSVFAAIMYMNPTKIYIHTDFNTSSIAHAAERGNRWTRKLLTTWPELVEWNHVVAPNFAGPNEAHRVDAIQHKSDFVRWDQIGETGGVYLDFDVITLRPLDPLLNSGFAAILGRQYGNEHEGGSINGTLNNGAFFSIPHSAMSTIVKKEQHAGFNGAWESNLIANTRTAEYLVSIPNECLILDRHAFAPTHWFPDSQEGTDNLYHPQPGPASPEPVIVKSKDPVQVYESVVRNRRMRREWELDWSSSYMLHAFAMGHNQQYIHPRIILERTTNYGVAVWELVKEMIRRGYIEGTEGANYADS
ncbi:hypothetical protein NX059_000167 [Plenodomus lindquistii]|nr:hypothetical protein NX059_000167 [Plenodomus lindquistii]